MKKLTMLVEFKYDDVCMYGVDEEEEAGDGKRWFFETVLKEDLFLVSGEIGENIGSIKILNILGEKNE